MSGIDGLAATILAQLDTEAQAAEAATPGPWEAVVDDHGAGSVDASVWADSIGYYVTEKLSSGDRHIADGRHITRHDPASVLRRVAAERELLELFLAEPHFTAVSCAALTGRDFCDCGRDARVAAYLRVLAEPYQETT